VRSLGVKMSKFAYLTLYRTLDTILQKRIASGDRPAKVNDEFDVDSPVYGDTACRSDAWKAWILIESGQASNSVEEKKLLRTCNVELNIACLYTEELWKLFALVCVFACV
jgi:hypothetical protein